jgi:glutamine amidotransferase
VIAIVDVGVGNLRSVEKALLRAGAAAVRTDDPARVRAATHVVLPGVGAFGDFMAALGRRGLDAVVHEQVGRGVPLLGVCVGMQALYDESEEFGLHRGLGLVPGRVVRLPDEELVVPHSGWNLVTPVRDDPLLPAPGWFYFVHSFRAVDRDPSTTLATTEYGVPFTAACRRGPCFGVQFHPEKSQQAGLDLLARFAALPSPLGLDPARGEAA